MEELRRTSRSTSRCYNKVIAENDVRALISSWRGIKKTDANMAICSKWSISNRVFGIGPRVHC